MINVYKKIEKSKECPTGYIDVTDSIFYKPFLFCISAQDNHDKSIYGTIREGAQAARVYTSQEDGGAYKIDEFPIDFLGVRFVRDNNYNNVSEELVDKYIYPYLISSGKDYDSLIKKAKMMNFMTYCDGTQTYKNIEFALKKKLLDLGISEDKVRFILSNMHLVAVATMVDTTDLDSSCISLIDINDDEVLTEESYLLRDGMERDGLSYSRYSAKPNIGMFYYSGSGAHSLKEYLKKGVYIKPYFHFIIARILEASASGIDYNMNEILRDIELFSKNGLSDDENLNLIDNFIGFRDAPRYTEGELVLRKELDELYKSYAREHEKRVLFEKSIVGYRDNQSRIISNIRKYSSDMTFLQILCDIGLWQAPGDADPYEHPSDRDIRSKIEDNNNFHM